MDLLENLLSGLLRDQKAKRYTSMDNWFNQHLCLSGSIEDSRLRALNGGYHSEQVSYAFASGYQSAMESMFNASQESIAALCASEQGGTHPRAISTTLTLLQEQDHFILNGSKRFVSGGKFAKQLFVLAKTGEMDGRPRLTVVKLAENSIGLDVEPMPALTFIPELSHASLRFSDIHITKEAVLSGDGYTNYVKPFRTCEDIHISFALLGYRLREAHLAGNEAASTELIALIYGFMQLGDTYTSSMTHVALAGLQKVMQKVFSEYDSHYADANPEGYKNWVRDKGILLLAEKAQQARTQKAWQHLKRGNAPR